MKPAYLFAIVLSAMFWASCDKYFGDKTDTDFLTPPDFSQRPAFYVPVQPVLAGLQKPTDVVYGFDELIYVVDSAAELVISYDQSGRQLSRFRVPGAKKVAQDRALDLLVLGHKDTVINNSNQRFDAVYRLDITHGGVVNLGAAQITNTLVHPFYYKNTFSSTDASTRFTDIAVYGDNSYYVSRTGEFPGSPGLPPDDAVIFFNENDVYQSPVFVNSQGRLVRDFFKVPSAITTFMQPPQISAQAFSRNFIYCSSPQERNTNEFRIRTIEYVITENGASYGPVAPVQRDTSTSSGTISDSEKYFNPTGITVAGDGTNYIFVVDADTDSLYQFSGNGLEGVNPPAGAASDKNIIVSFGGTGNGLTQFNRPSAVAYANEIVYVADRDNGRVLRFRLTTDFD